MTGTEIKPDLDGINSSATLLRFIEKNWQAPILFEWPFGRLDVQNVEVLKTWHVRGRKVGYHLTVFVTNQISPLDLVLLQWTLGSDPYRELRNVERITEMKLPVWNVFFRDKLNGGGDYVSHEGRPDTQTAKKIMAVIRKWREPN